MPEKSFIKNTGATFTPPNLAEFLAEKLIEHLNLHGGIEVLDPACGDGELLLAIGNALSAREADFSLTGFDTNPEYLELAANRTLTFEARFVLGDFLEAIDLTEPQLSLALDNEKKPTDANCSADIIIANPPYVRTQILGSAQAQRLAKKFGLKGRVDLYYPFLIAMTESLKEGGILGVITSNRYLSTKGGESIRKYLAENYEIIELIDLGDTKLFDAAVLPAIFIGRKQKRQAPAAKAKFLKIYEELNGYEGHLVPAENVFAILNAKESGYFCVGNKKYKKTKGVLKYDLRPGSPWEMLAAEETRWVSTIDKHASCTVGDWFKVRVGIKTTADKVFIKEHWDGLGKDKPEGELLKDMLSQENIEPWGVTCAIGLQVLYTHTVENGKKRAIDIDDYPKAKQYLLANEAVLKAREYVLKAGRKWYEIWVPQNPDSWAKPKLVFPDISPTPRFCFDPGGKVVNGNCYWIAAESSQDIDKLFLIQGVANSKLMTRYHDLVFNNKLYSGRRRYFTQYVERYPLPDVESDTGKEIVCLAKNLNKETGKAAIKKLEKKLEAAVAQAFGVSDMISLD